MRDFEETDGWDSAEGDGFGDGASVSEYDPLFSPWAALSGETASFERTAPAPGAGTDPLDAYAALSGESWAPPYADDRLSWEGASYAAGSAFDEAAFRPSGGRPSSWYATRWGEAWADYAQLTEAQRRLREGVITIPRPARRWPVIVREFAETVLLAVLIFLSVRASFQNFKVDGISMSPSLEDGEYLIVNKLSYAEVDLSVLDWLPFFDSGDNPVRHLWGKPSRGDVVVFRAPTSPDRDFIKRIIGTPGDTLEITPDGRVIVNGSVLDEPYANGQTTCNSSTCRWEIPESGSEAAYAQCGSANCYFVMGDNRQNSSDSRQGWLVPEENIIGKALITYWHDGGPELELAPNHGVQAAEPDD